MGASTPSIAAYYLETDRRSAENFAADAPLLDASERARREAFAFEDDQREYVAAHALLRRALSLRRQVEPAAWRFDAGEFGKPFVSNADFSTPPQFSLSHTRGLVACVVAEAAHVGIDVEPLERPRTNIDRVAERFFAPAEVNDLRSLPPAERRARFAELWVLKEAYIKAIARGLAHPLQSFSFQFVDRDGLAFTADDDSPAEWQFALFAAAGWYRLAIAARGLPHEFPLRVWDAAQPSCEATLLRRTRDRATEPARV